MDYKQQRLISGWIQQAESSEDPYFSFMALWIAFNASCYASFHESANQQRADLKSFQRSSPIDGSMDARVLLKGDELSVKADTLQMGLTIREKYSEDKIFAKFASTMQRVYRSRLDEDEKFNSDVDHFRVAIRKRNGWYVLNLSRQGTAEVDSWDEDQIKTGTNLFSSFHDKHKLSLLKDTLYQVRCNVFHGEKIPGDVNDDRIVRTANSVLRGLLDMSLVEPSDIASK